MFERKLKTILPFTISVIAGMGIFFLQQQYAQKNLENQVSKIDYSQDENKLKASLALQKKLPTFGFDNLIGDWLYLQFIQYFGDNTARETTGYSLVTDYFELLTEYDPRFINAYFTLSSANSIYAGKPQETVNLLNKILPQISPEIDPLAFNLWTYKAVDEILFLGEIQEAKKSYEMAAQWALTRDDDIGEIVAKRSLETAQFLANNPDSKKAQVSAWATVLNGAFDDQTRQMAIDKIRGLGGEIITSPDGRVQVKLPEQD